MTHNIGYIQLNYGHTIHVLRNYKRRGSMGCHSDLNDQNLFHSTIDAPPGVPGVSKNLDDQTEVYSGELKR